MNRLGIDEIIDFKKCLKIIQNNRNIVLQGVFTHFATIENDNIFKEIIIILIYNIITTVLFL